MEARPTLTEQEVAALDAFRRGLSHQDPGDARLAARAYTPEHGGDDPAIRDWTWPF